MAPLNRFVLGGLGAWGGGQNVMRLVSLSGQARSVAALASVAAVGSVAYVRSWPKEVPKKDPTRQKLLLDRVVMEMVCGAVGEVAQICVLYPLETIKVKCQAEGQSVAVVLQALLAKGPGPAWRALYAGFVSAAACSMLVGAVHYASFCVSKRAALQAEAQLSGAAAASSSAGDGGGHGHGGTSASSNLMAAAIGALSTALVESPCELFRHQAQAGMVSGNFAAEMARAVRSGGPGALYWGFVPFLMESFPYDITELGVYSQLHDVREAAAKEAKEGGGRGGRRSWVAQVPDQVWDVAIGAAAGVAAVTMSMPFDVIKTYMQTHASLTAATGPAGQAAAFVATARALVAAKGPGGLFVGMAPRLVQQVPSTTICWWTIEQCRDALEPWTKP